MDRAHAALAQCAVGVAAQLQSDATAEFAMMQKRRCELSGPATGGSERPLVWRVEAS